MENIMNVQCSAKTLARTCAMLWECSPSYSLALTAVLVVQGLSPMASIWMTKLVVDGITHFASSDSTWSNVLLPVCIWISVNLAEALLAPVATSLQGIFADRLTAHMNLALMQKATSFADITRFEDHQYYDELQIISREISWRPMNFVTFSVGFVTDSIRVIGILILLSEYNVFFALLVIGSTIPYSVVSFRLERTAHEAIAGGASESRRMQYYNSVTLSDIYAKEIRVFGLARFFIELYRNSFHKVHYTLVAIRKRQATVAALWVAVGVGGSSVAFLWILHGVHVGIYSVGGVIVLIQSIYYGQDSVRGVVTRGTLLADCTRYIQRFFSFLDIPTSVDNGHGLSVPRKSSHSIEFRQVSFTYGGGRDAVDNINFVVSPGETVALVGENGAGKTTIVKLLARLYSPDTGEILLDGINVLHYDVNDYRRQIGVVFQDFCKYQLSARDNISLGDLICQGDIASIRHAAEQAGIDKRIDLLPNGYDTLLGKQFEGGIELSGGEWQKIALARAFIRQAPILILDEPNSALDARSEEELFRQFIQLAKGRTTILISHRLSSVKLAQRIFVLKGGRLVEAGTHEDLMACNGEYAEMYRMQADHYQ